MSSYQAVGGPHFAARALQTAAAAAADWHDAASLTTDSSSHSPSDATTASLARTTAASSMASDRSSCAPTPPTSVDTGALRARLPTEIFIAAAAHLSQRDLIGATQVCHTWRKALLASSNLWQDCTLCIDAPFALDKLQVYCLRAAHNLHRLTFYLAPNSVWWDMDFIHDRFSSFRQTLLALDGGARIDYLNFSAYDFNGYAVAALASFGAHMLLPNAHTAYLDPSNATLLEIKVPWHVFNLSRGFLWFFQAVDSVRFLSRPTRLLSYQQQLDFGHISEQQLGSPPQAPLRDYRTPHETTRLDLQSVYLGFDTRIPDFSNLAELRLSFVVLGQAFYGMLQSAAPRLELLETHSITLHPSDLRRIDLRAFWQPAERPPAPGPPSADPDDDQALELDEWDCRRPRYCVTLPNLRVLRASGTHMIAWWQSALGNVPEVFMPRLRTVSLIDCDCLDEVVEPRTPLSPRRQLAIEMQIEDGDFADLDDSDLMAGLLPMSALWNITSVARHLRCLDLSCSVITDATLIEALRFAPHLEMLVMKDMPDISTWGARAVASCHSLRSLDIRGTDLPAVAVARIFEHIRDFGGRLQSVYMDDPGPLCDGQSESDLHMKTAYQWLEWIDVLVDWQQVLHPKSWHKRIWQPINLLEEVAPSLDGVQVGGSGS